MSTSRAPITPSRLRSDIYGLSSHDDPSPPLVISVLASLLERAISRNQRPRGGREGAAAVRPAAEDHRALAFDSHRVLAMTIQAFLERIFRYTDAGPAVFVVAYVYIDRLCRVNPGLRVTQRNAHRLLVTTIMVASKFVEDRNYRNSFFAKVGGLPTSELNRLEVDLLFLMGFKLHVSVSVFESYCRHLEREVGAGGGYQIERTLRFMCSGETTASKEGDRSHRTELNQLARVL